MSLEVIKGSLFDAPKGAVLIHACNCMGSWGRGIAGEFKKRYPKASAAFNQCFESKTPQDLIGTAYLIQSDDKKYLIANLFTSKDVSYRKDPKNLILTQTKSAFEQLLTFPEVQDKPLCSCKIDQGLFQVPWMETEAILKEALALTGMECIVYDPDLK